MPVSKKRKKDGKKVQRRAAEPLAPQEEGHPAPERSGANPRTGGPPKNPFVSTQQHRGAQRGR